MKFKIDSAFRNRIASLAKSVANIEIVDEDEVKGIYSVREGDTIYTVTARLISDSEIDVSCDCEAFSYSAMPCIHIATLLRQKYDISTNSFNVPGFRSLADAKLAEAKLPETTKPAEVKPELAHTQVESRVQKLITLDEEKIAELADEFDVRQIVISLAGEYEDLPMIYEFKDSKGQSRTVVSWNGYIKAARLQGNIKVEFLGFDRVGDRVIAKAKAIDLKQNIEIPAVASRLPKSTEFTYEILASKAIRNALKKVIDPDILAKVIEHAKKMQSVKEVQLKEVASP